MVDKAEEVFCTMLVCGSMAVHTPHSLNGRYQLGVKYSRYQGFLVLGPELGEGVSLCLLLISLGKCFSYQLGMGGNIKFFPRGIKLNTLGHNLGDRIHR